MKKNFDAFIEQDHKEHLERSLEALIKHADRQNEVSTEERIEYFKGLMGMFPMMMLGHYYGWLIEDDPKGYFEVFVPAFEQKEKRYAEQIVERLFDKTTSAKEQAVLLAVYLQTYPFDLLMEFVLWAGPDAITKAGAFIATERNGFIAELFWRITDKIERGDYTKLAAYLGGDYPFELLSRFHKTVMG